jgi:hypothetical protein
MTGQSISQQFWAYHAIHPVYGWVLIGLMSAAFITWMVHLAWKRIRNT